MPDEKTLLLVMKGLHGVWDGFLEGSSGSQTVPFPGPAVRAAAGS